MLVVRTLYLREQGWEDQWLFFEAKRGSRAKTFGKHRFKGLILSYTWILL